jgi:LysR family transcriptional regulator, low CO2-responsive transcriptional regulator
MNYTLHQLQIFLKITQTQSITKAAEDLHLTQPAVSIQLKNFQDQFEIPLIDIIGRRIFITDFGREIAVAAENILNEVYAINYKTMAHKGQLTGRLKISIVSTGQYIMPYFLSDFLQQHSGIELMLDVTNKAKVLESLKNNEVDFSLVSVLPDQLPIDKITLMDNKLYLVNNKNTSFNNKPYDKNFLETLPLIYREPGSGTRYVMEQFIEQNNLSVRKKMELTSNEAVKQAVIAGLGCSIMPLIGIKNEITNGDLQIIPVKGLPIISKWNIIWMKSKNFSPVSTSFLKYLNEEKDRIMQEKFDWIK